MLDERNTQILNERIATFALHNQPKVGDFVRFSDGTLRRVSHVWLNEDNTPSDIQTSDEGSFYLGNGYMSMSGSLYTSVPAETFKRTNETMSGDAWFFNHDYHAAHNGIDVKVPCPVWNCQVAAPA